MTFQKPEVTAVNLFRSTKFNSEVPIYKYSFIFCLQIYTLKVMYCWYKDASQELQYCVILLMESMTGTEVPPKEIALLGIVSFTATLSWGRNPILSKQFHKIIELL